MNKKASVIIPVYNAENYLPKCFESILAQSYKNIEIVIVNDGSTDSSQKIIEEFHSKFPKIIKPFIQENSGIAASRNNGLTQAVGDYIFFIDHDDYIDSDYLRHYIEKAEFTNADMVIGGFRRVSETGRTLYTYKLKNTPWSAYRIQTPWARLYKTDFLKENNLLFLDIKLGEDASFNIPANVMTDKITITDYTGYNWVDIKKSFSNTVQKQPDNSDEVIKLLSFIKTKTENTALSLLQKQMIEYFCIKYSIWFLLYSTKKINKMDLENKKNKIFENLTSLFPKWTKNTLVSPFSPKGECFAVRNIVWFLTVLKKIGCAEAFFNLYSKI